MTMISRGRAIGGKGIAAGMTRYLLHNPKNEKAIFLGARGTAWPNDLQKSLEQMVLMGELTKSEKPLYHGIISPDLNVDKTLSRKDWERFVEIQADELGLDADQCAMVGHHKIGKDGQLRVHLHIIYQRTDIENGKMRTCEFDRAAHARARERIEIEFGHERTFQRHSLEEMERLQAEHEAKKRNQENMAEILKNKNEIEDDERLSVALERMRQTLKVEEKNLKINR